ncbi:hypothetical protein Tco_0389701 [Tanacetum coccineum]
MEDEHLDTIPETESDELIKSSVEDLVQSQVIRRSPKVSGDMPPITSIPSVIDSFYAESNLIESLLNRNTSIDSSSKIDSLLDEFAGELTLLHSIPPGIDDVNLDPEGIESDDYDSEDDDNSTFRPEFESFHVDYPDSGDSTIDVVEDIPVDVPNILAYPSPYRNKIYDPGICIEVESTRFLSTLSPVIDTLLSFSSENDDKVFIHGVLAYKEKSLLIHHIGACSFSAFLLKPDVEFMGTTLTSLVFVIPIFYPP